MEYRFLASDGSVVWVLDHATLINRTDVGDPGSFQGMMLDITARKEAERKAEAAEDRFRTLTERGPVVAYTFDLAYEGQDDDPRLDITYLSPQAADLVHFPVEHWVEDPMVWFEMVHPDDRERVAENGRHNWRTGDPWSIRYRMIRSDGEVIWLLDTGGMVERDVEGRPWKFQGILFDVTVDEQARARLETAERDQREALEGALAIPWAETIQPETGAERYTYIGPQALDILGYTPEELMVESSHFPRMVHPDDRARVSDLLRALRGDGHLGGHLSRPPARRRDPLAPFVRTADVGRRRGAGALAGGGRRRDGDAGVERRRDGLVAWRTSGIPSATSRPRDSGLRLEASGPGRAPAGRDAASRGSPRCRRRAGGSP